VEAIAPRPFHKDFVVWCSRGRGFKSPRCTA
jgi:hypothetical protein